MSKQDKDLPPDLPKMVPSEESIDINDNSEYKENYQKTKKPSSSSSTAVPTSSSISSKKDDKILIESVRGIFAVAFPTLQMTEKGFASLAKALQLFVLKLTKETVEHSKASKIEYSHVANYVQNSNTRAIYILRDMLPKKIQYSTIKERVLTEEN